MKKDKTILEIVPKEAEYIKQIYDLYLSGSGYRKIATYLTEHGAPTPSMIQREREIEEGRLSKKAGRFQMVGCHDKRNPGQ
ncbi:MAG: recombinase family protein [Blautia faecis]